MTGLAEKCRNRHARYQTLQEQDSIAAQQTVTQEALVTQYQGLVEMDKAQVTNAKLQLSYTTIDLTDTPDGWDFA